MTIKDHAVQRFIERHRPDLTEHQARRLLKRLARRARRYWEPGEGRNTAECDGIRMIFVRDALITVR